MRRAWRRLACAVLVLLVTVAGCSTDPDPKEATMDADQARSVVSSEAKDAAAALTTDEATVEKVTGGFEGCGGGQLSARQARYTAGGAVSGGAGTLSERIEAAVRTLTSAGWTVKDTGTSPQGVAYGRLTRDDLELSLDRDQLQGSDDFVFGVAGPCFETTGGQADDLPRNEQILP